MWYYYVKIKIGEYVDEKKELEIVRQLSVDLSWAAYHRPSRPLSWNDFGGEKPPQAKGDAEHHLAASNRKLPAKGGAHQKPHKTKKAW